MYATAYLFLTKAISRTRRERKHEKSYRNSNQLFEVKTGGNFWIKSSILVVLLWGKRKFYLKDGIFGKNEKKKLDCAR